LHTGNYTYHLGNPLYFTKYRAHPADLENDRSIPEVFQILVRTRVNQEQVPGFDFIPAPRLSKTVS